jgi:hypothetical protein
MINEQNNLIVNKHFELEIKTLQTAPKDEEKLEAFLKENEREKEEAMQIDDTQRPLKA